MTMTPNPQRVLVLQTAVPAYVKRAIEDILEKRLLGDVHITLFCRALPDESAQFGSIPWIGEVIVHDEARAMLEHLHLIRRHKYDVVVVFFTGDPSYWKMKYFAFLCGGRHLLIFNEHLGCFFYTHRLFARFLLSRYREWKVRTKQRLGYALGTPQGLIPENSSSGRTILRPAHLALKLLIFPLRWIYLYAWTSAMQYRRRKYLQQHGRKMGWEGDSL